MPDDIDTERRALLQFRRLLDLDADARAAFEAELARSEPHAAQRVRAMLERHQQETDRLLRGWREHDAVTVPTRLGPFRLGRELGRGGMGTVVLGEREAEGFVQHVAVKWIAGAQIDPQRRARFMFERDVVARLQHPHIASLIDGGEGENGELWYAMERVDGTDLPTHCRVHRLALRERAALLLDLCDAVAHAHRHSILHRDIKPGNVLVTTAGNVRLIDFGIARALDADDAALTRDAAPMTPRYAAPEQRRGERATTATDQWQLGALAYEVLCGQLARRDGESAIPPPSRRARDAADADAAPFGLDAAALARALAGDLDALLMRALHDDPAQRYASVDEFARELRDWLAGRPLASRRHERWYASRRFVQRHRWSLGFAALAGIALLAASIASTLAARHAREQAAVADASSMLLSRMFVSSYNAPNLPGMTVRDFFSHAIDTALADTTLPAEQRCDLLHDLIFRARELRATAAAERAARGFLALAPQVAGPQSLYVAIGHDHVAATALLARGIAAADEAQHHLDRAEDIYTALELQRNPEYATTHLRELARLAELRADPDRMLAVAQRAVALSRALKPGQHLNLRALIAWAHEAAGRHAQAADEAERIVHDTEVAAADDPSLANMLDWQRGIACELRARSDPPSALAPCTALVDRLRRSGRLQTRLGSQALLGLGLAQASLSADARALDSLHEAERVLAMIEGEDARTRERFDLQRAIGHALQRQGHFAAAIGWQQNALAGFTGYLGDAHPDSLGTRRELDRSVRAAASAPPPPAALDAGTLPPMTPLSTPRSPMPERPQ